MFCIGRSLKSRRLSIASANSSRLITSTLREAAESAKGYCHKMVCP